MATPSHRMLSLRGSPRHFWAATALGIGLACSAAASEKVLTIGTPILTANAANPYQALGYPAILTVTAIYDPLTIIDAEGRVQPWLAVGWSTENSVDWLITLRENVVFSNGRALDATVLIESVKHMKTVTGRAETVGSNLADIAGIKAVSDRQVLVTLMAPDPVLPLRLALWRVPEPVTFQEAADNGHQTFAAGTGPFKPTAWSAAQITLMADETSWRRPRVTRLAVIQIADQVARSQALTSGDIDVALELGVGGQRRITDMDAQLVPRRMKSMPYIGFALEHVDSTPLEDVRVRRALNYAVNKRLIVDVLFHGLVEPVAQLALPGAAGYDPDLEPYTYDPEKARQLLAEAGYPDGFDVTFRTSATGADMITYTQQIAADLAAVNVHATLQLAPSTQMTLMLFHGKFNAELFSMGGRGLAPARDYRFRACLGLVGRFKPFFCDEVVNKLITRARSTSTYEEMESAMRAVLLREHENPPGIFLWDGRAFDGVANHVLNFESDTDFIHLHRIELASN